MCGHNYIKIEANSLIATTSVTKMLFCVYIFNYVRKIHVENVMPSNSKQLYLCNIQFTPEKMKNSIL